MSLRLAGASSATDCIVSPFWTHLCTRAPLHDGKASDRRAARPFAVAKKDGRREERARALTGCPISPGAAADIGLVKAGRMVELSTGMYTGYQIL